MSDPSDIFRQMLASQQSAGGGGRQAWFEKMVNQGAANLSGTNLGPLKGQVPMMFAAGNNRGMFGALSNAVPGFLPKIFDQIKACSGKLAEHGVAVTGSDFSGSGIGRPSSGASFDINSVG